MERLNHAGTAIEIIDRALEDLYPLVSIDVLASEVWQSLSEGVAQGWCSADEAQERYTAWHERYHANHWVAPQSAPETLAT